MDNLQIDLGIKRIMINDDPDNVLEFNPSDIVFAEKFYLLVQEVQAKEKEFLERAEALGLESEEDKLPPNFPDQLKLIREVCNFVKAEIDKLFGEGTSQKLFGDAETLFMFEQFFDGITPFIQHARETKMRKYRSPKKVVSASK